MLQLLMPRSTRSSRVTGSDLLRRALNAGALAVRSAFAPETLFVSADVAPDVVIPVETPQPVRPVEEPAEAEPVEMPSDEEIEAAAALYFKASDQARRADRSKRAAKKVLGVLPVGTYGGWHIGRKASSRTTPDLDKIAAIFKTHGLGPVPMRPVADSLVVTRSAEVEELAA